MNTRPATLTRSPDAQSTSAHYLDLAAAIKRYNAMCLREHAGATRAVRWEQPRLICLVAWQALAERMTSAWLCYAAEMSSAEMAKQWVDARIRNCMLRAGVLLP